MGGFCERQSRSRSMHDVAFPLFVAFRSLVSHLPASQHQGEHVQALYLYAFPLPFATVLGSGSLRSLRSRAKQWSVGSEPGLFGWQVESQQLGTVLLPVLGDLIGGESILNGRVELDAKESIGSVPDLVPGTALGGP